MPDMVPWLHFLFLYNTYTVNTIPYTVTCLDTTPDIVTFMFGTWLHLFVWIRYVPYIVI